jgi:hypothetical protein
MNKLITRATSRPMRSLSRTTVGKMVSRMNQISENHHYIFQHGRQPCPQQQGDVVWLKNKQTEVWEKKTLSPSSPDCNPFDYFAGGVFDLRVRANPQKKTRDLILYIREVMGFLARNTVAKSCKMFRSRIDAVVAADGNFIE